ncbi:6,7-dimethyl-8-ribityllumazine synthase [Pseudochelatococcus sp. G4_1912]|jgi:6,7-dimethyl-8-ribityllumazine synthase|uniref:6,7-dimethyl-8-ribityllumazine synthase n=1 Tax=Pseudochelatococcus sp. G4_1912 TaxID=3114288 RepID=UPI0039C6067B
MAQSIRLTDDDFSGVSGARVLIVEARYYAEIADELLKGTKAVLEAAGAEYDVITVPGALEIAPAIAIAIAEGLEVDAVVALGTVIRGETSHYDIVAGESSRALTDLSLEYLLPIGNGILTVENAEQAWVRARVSEEDKGGFAARAALSLVGVRRQIANGIED